MKPGKHQRTKQRCQDLGWKIHDRAKSFVLRSYTMHELRNQHVSIGQFPAQYGVNNYCVLCTVKTKKANKNIRQRNLSGFITMPLYLVWREWIWANSLPGLLTYKTLRDWLRPRSEALSPVKTSTAENVMSHVNEDIFICTWKRRLIDTSASEESYKSPNLIEKRRDCLSRCNS